LTPLIYTIHLGHAELNYHLSGFDPAGLTAIRKSDDVRKNKARIQRDGVSTVRRGKQRKAN
jgi:hypothetical protein